MENKIFYSWQSDLPNSTNRSFIERCLKRAIEELRNEDEIHLDIAVDRDTQGVSGTPEITESIFSKIDDCDLFVADISIINSGTDKRPCPNPNVLVELGYAAKTLNWNNIICVYNTAYGNIGDLPFDLRGRRSAYYELKVGENKNNASRQLVNVIKSAITNSFSNHHSNNIFFDYGKSRLEEHIVDVYHHLFNLLYNYQMDFNLNFANLLKISNTEVEGLLKGRDVLCFGLIKDWTLYARKIERIVNQAVLVDNFKAKHQKLIVAIMSNLNNLYGQVSNLFLNFFRIETQLDNSLRLSKYGETNEYSISRKGDQIDSGPIHPYLTSLAKHITQIPNGHLVTIAGPIHSLLSDINKWFLLTGDDYYYNGIIHHFNRKQHEG
ncbi:MAG: hypothetical protein R2800_02650 [Flavipsychrobacter sp.]